MSHAQQSLALSKPHHIYHCCGDRLPSSENALPVCSTGIFLGERDGCLANSTGQSEGTGSPLMSILMSSCCCTSAREASEE